MVTIVATWRIALALLSPVYSVFAATTACGNAAASLARTAGPRSAGNAAIWSDSFLIVKRIAVGFGHDSENG